MFRKIVFVAAALILSLLVISASSMVSAGATGTDTGPCITATWRDDPSITAQRGYCPPTATPTVEPVPTATPTVPADPTPVAFFTMMSLDADFDGDGLPDHGGIPYHVRLVNLTSGAVVWDRAGSVEGQTSMADFVMVPAAQTPVYSLTVTADGKTYGFITSSADFIGSQYSQSSDKRLIVSPDGIKVRV